MRAFTLLAVVVLASACQRAAATNLDVDLIDVAGARMRTDTVGGEGFTDRATFVLVDAWNRADRGAHVTLGGDLTDAGGAVVATLKPQSLWIPGGESRTFALVDGERKARETAVAAKIEVRGAMVPEDPPRVHVEELHSFGDQGRVIVQAYVVNEADRIGQVVVVGAFHDAEEQPMTRPFEVVEVGAKSRQVVKFVGPEGSKRGTIFVGDVVY